ncbi:hypothetical protein [Corynebacterium jeikeium]|uniref:hypothetical protein n=1 Tax=Corynebacterium jeikeium TaxID=38289 RepID=UPI00088A05BC|nr:hypothetical protein [Corynebacterium jeikeium]SCX22121.1 hypothetical protein CJBVI_1656 [Corynebacterium jeikeium]
MAHYNLYESLGIDRSASTQDIAENIDKRLSTGNTSNPGGEDELQVARQIIADPTKRGMYDARLDDPNAPEIDIAALRDLAELQVPAQGQPPQPQPQPLQFQQFQQSQQPKQPSKLQREFARSSKLALTLAAVVPLLAVLVLFGAYKGVSWFFGDEREVKNLSQEFLDLRKKGETQMWLDDNVGKDAMTDAEDYFDLDDGGYEGMNKEFDALALEPGEVTKSNDFARFVLAEDQVDRYKDFYWVSIEDNNGKLKGMLFFGIANSGPKLLYVEKLDR